MRTYHPKSWSEQARNFGDILYIGWVEGNSPLTLVNTTTFKYWTIYGEKAAIWMLNNSYKSPLVVNRAAKRVGRLVRKHKR